MKKTNKIVRLGICARKVQCIKIHGQREISR